MTLHARAVALALSSFALLWTVACSSDDDGTTEEDEAESPCVTVTYYAASGGAEPNPACVELPSECANQGSPCGHDVSACEVAMDALCTDAERETCVAASLNGRVTSVDLGCRRP